MKDLHSAAVYRALNSESTEAPSSNVIVLESWRRCVDRYGLAPDDQPDTNVLSRAELQDARDPLIDLIESAKSEMARLFSLLSHENYLVTLTSTSGVTLEFLANNAIQGVAADLGLRQGAVWQEEAQGTTGVGTCLKTEEPVTILKSEHFSSLYQGVTCTVAPIFNGDGTLCAVLNVTTPCETTHQTQALVRTIVTMSARRIQYAMFRKAHANALVLRLSNFADFADVTQEGLVALNTDGVIAGLENCGQQKNDVHDFDIRNGQSISDVLGLSVDQLQASFRRESVIEVSPVGEHATNVFAKLEKPVRKSGFATSGAARQVSKSTAVMRGQSETTALRKLCGKDAQMLHNADVALKVFNLSIPVLLLGETGSGKGAFAKALHEASNRSDKPFIAVNCAAIPESLIESELFGYRPGAFTGADKAGHRGQLIAANGGTLFLDEIGDMPTALQTRLLRVLSEGEVVPLGGDRPVNIDVRVVSATLQDLPKLVSEGRFREDLYFRLNGASLQLPPLRERTDLRDLIFEVLQVEARESGQSAEISDELCNYLASYFWQGNFRELVNTLRFCLAMSEGNVLEKHHLPTQMQNQTSEGESVVDGHDSVDREITVMALEREGWNVSAASRLLGISRATLHRRIKALQISRDDRK